MPEERRHDPRYEIETRVLYRAELPDVWPPTVRGGQTRNLSAAGLLLEADEPLPVGARLSPVRIRTKRGVVEGQAEVMWGEGPAPMPRVRQGVRITLMRPVDRLGWELFLFEARREIGRRPIRFDTDPPVICRERDSPLARGGRAANASHSGLSILLRGRFPLGTVLSLEIQVPGRRLRTEARVVRWDVPTPEGLIPHGLTFVDPQEGSRLLPELLLVGLL